MNIFALDNDPRKAAQYHCDKHVVKMCVEYCQILSTVLRMKGIEDDRLYKRTHEAHPCVVWAAMNPNNFTWLLTLTRFLFNEFRHRYKKTHKSEDVLDVVDTYFYAGKLNPLFHPAKKRMPFVKCMPAEYKEHADPVECYRLYCFFEKHRIMRWKKREKPYWFKKIHDYMFRSAGPFHRGVWPSSNAFGRGTGVYINGVTHYIK